MNLKEAKRLRRRAKEIACQYVKDRVLDAELTKGESCATLVSVLPQRMYLNKPGTRSAYNAVGTQRFFNRMVKKNPEITYEQIMEYIYGTQPQ